MKKYFLTLFIILTLAVPGWAAITFDNNGGGGDGKWNTITNWIGGAKPTATDDAIIAANCQIDAAAICKTLTVNAGVTMSGSSQLEVLGSFTLNGTSVWSKTGNVYIERTGTITTNGVSCASSNWDINPLAATTVTIASDLTVGTLAIRRGICTLSNITLTCSYLYDSSDSNATTINLGSSTININSRINYGTTPLTITSSGAHINITPGNSNYTHNLGSVNWGDAHFTINTGTYNSIQTLAGANTLGALTLTKTSGTPTFKFTQGTTTTFGDGTNSFTANGFILTSSDGANAATLSQSSGTNTLTNCTLTYLTAAGGATWNAFTDTNTVDQPGTCSGWTLTGVSAPTATISAATDMTTTTGTGNASSTDGGGTVTERGILLKAGGTPTTADYDKKFTGTGTSGDFTVSMTGLTVNTGYTARAYAINEIGTGYSTTTTYTTLRNPGTFYMRSDGTAANLAAATGPSSTQTNCMNVTVHNAATLIPGDTIYISDKGGDYTPDQLTWSPDGEDGLIIAPNSGTAINPIIYANVPGENPTINMTWVKDHDGSIWTDLGGGIYETNADLIYYARVMWEDGVVLQKATSAALTNGREYYAAGRLYYKPTSGTPADHTLTAIWFTDTNWSPYAFDMRERSYIDVSGLTINYGGIGVAQNMETPGTSNLIGIKVHGCTFNYAPWAIWGQVINNVVFQDAEFYSNTLNYCNGGISIWTNSVETAHTQKPLRVKVYNNTINHHFSVDASNNWKYAWASTSPDHEAISFQDAVSCEVKNNIITHDLPLTTEVRAIFLYNNGNSDSIDDNIIAFNKISGGYDRAINFSGYTTSAQGNIIACNSIYCPLTSISIIPKQNNQIYVNILSNPATGMNYIYNNSIFTAVTDTGAGSVGIYLVTDSGKWTVGNNIISMDGGACIIGDATNKTDYVISYNNYYGGTFYADESPVNWATWQGLGWDVTGSFENQDPKFLLTGSDPLKLAGDSPCINAGTTPPGALLPLLSVDIDGNPRPR